MEWTEGRDEQAAIRARFNALWMKRLDKLLPAPTVLLGGVIAWYSAAPIAAIGAVAAYVLVNVLLSVLALRDDRISPDGALRILAAVMPMCALVFAAGPDGHGWILTTLPAAVAVFAGRRATILRAVLVFNGSTTLATVLVGASTQTTLVAAGVLFTVSWLCVGLHETMLTVWIRAEIRGAALAATNKALTDALAVRQRFLATMSHEVRTPMNAVLGAAALLESERLDADQRKLVAVIEDSGRGLLRVLDDILDTARLEAGAVEIEQIPYDPARLVAGIGELMALTIQRPGVALLIDAGDPPPQVIGDPTRLRQVLLNLVSNAIKFTEHGSVTLRARWADDRLGFEVIDTGIGIAAEAQAHLFDPFVQAERGTTRRFGGTGLGLTISQQLVALMGGELALASALGEGTRFHFSVVAPASAEQAPDEPAAAAAPLLPASVLVVDDNQINLMIAEQMLKRLGCVVHTASDGRAAVEAAAEADFDLVLMDCRMPVMDGFEATRTLRARGATIPILALTAGVTEEERQRCLACGMDAVLQKPVSIQALRDALRRTQPRTAASG